MYISSSSYLSGSDLHRWLTKILLGIRHSKDENMFLRCNASIYYISCTRFDFPICYCLTKYNLLISFSLAFKLYKTSLSVSIIGYKQRIVRVNIHNMVTLNYVNILLGIA